MKILQHFILKHKIYATIRDYSMLWVTYMLRLFAAIPSAILFIRGYMQESNLIYIKNILVYSVNNEKKIKYDCI